MDYDPVWGPGRAASVMMEGSEAGKDIIVSPAPRRQKEWAMAQKLTTAEVASPGRAAHAFYSESSGTRPTLG
ncbi:MAG: hypothetical protein CYPHOPRED_002670 [Cyphobasidiales sp. Tagirdzhanova-0007]|nr:MAG: hypothetical protein CYPHOPRED_002670 [Cyphobasidiales sp. Tagirdzhanova-0007]